MIGKRASTDLVADSPFSYPTPILRPLGPFFVAAGIVFYGVNKLQDAGTSTEEAKKDPKNPYGMSKQIPHTT